MKAIEQYFHMVYMFIMLHMQSTWFDLAQFKSEMKPKFVTVWPFQNETLIFNL